MKQFLIFLFIAILIGSFYFVAKPGNTPERELGKAQESAVSAVQYFLDALRDKDVAKMKMISAENATNQCQMTLNFIKGQEKKQNVTLDEGVALRANKTDANTFYFMGVLSGQDESLGRLQILVRKREDGKWWIIRSVPE